MVTMVILQFQTKQEPTIADKLLKKIYETDSTDTIVVLASDGENSNTGWKGMFVSNMIEHC